MCLILWFHAKVFAEQLHKEKRWYQIYKNFRAMQTISSLVNAAVGNQVTGFVAEFMVYYSYNLNALLTLDNPVRSIEIMYFFVFAVVSFGFSANICIQVIM